MSGDEDKVQFKPIKRKNFRQRRNTSDDEESRNKEDVTETLAKVGETKEKQKLRNRVHGVNAVSLALGKKVSLEEEVTVKDPFKVKTGGMVNMQALKSGKLKTNVNDDAYDTGIGTQFSAETNIGDTDEQMMKYIDEQLSKRKGVETEKDEMDANRYLSPEEAAILSLPKHLRETSTKRSEEMLSNQMLNGIPEINLGIEAKIRNIEATEEAKMKILADQKNKKDLPSQFVPKNYAVNFIQHHRFNIDQGENNRKRPGQDDDKSNTKLPKKATDDYHFDKFRKQFRK